MGNPHSRTIPRGVWLLPYLPQEVLMLRGQSWDCVWVLSPMSDIQHLEARSVE